MNDKLIKDMQEGDSGYTLPWAVINYYGELLIYNKYKCEIEPGGTVKLAIRMVNGQVVASDCQELQDSISYRPARPLPGAISFTFKKYPHTGATNEDYTPVIIETE